jgi:hypothetical protein
MSLKRYTSIKNLRGLGRPLLKEFFGRFEKELGAAKITLPADTLEDDPYFKALADVFFSPKALPEAMTRVLEAVVELADDSGVAELTLAAKEAKLAIDWTKKRTNLDIVMQVWLVDADLMIRQHNEHRLVGKHQRDSLHPADFSSDYPRGPIDNKSQPVVISPSFCAAGSRSNWNRASFWSLGGNSRNYQRPNCRVKFNDLFWKPGPSQSSCSNDPSNHQTINIYE